MIFKIFKRDLKGLSRNILALAIALGLCLLARSTCSFWRIALAALAGLAVLYAVGLPYMAMILNCYMGKGMDLSAILWAGMLPFLPGDALKILVTAMLTPPIRRALDNSAK